MPLENVARSWIAGTQQGPPGGGKVEREEGDAEAPGVLGTVFLLVFQQLRPGQQVVPRTAAQDDVPQRERTGKRQAPPVSAGDDEPARAPAELRPCGGSHGETEDGAAVGGVRRQPQHLWNCQGPPKRPWLPWCHEAMVAGRFN